eukprot:NODE_11_length_46995_cov_0.451872.p4 type:complete len:749 gc:universal NODE_11_length_46995_cov_0.451872:11410-9164(-)
MGDFSNFTDMCVVLDLLTMKPLPACKKALSNIFSFLKNNHSDLLIPVIRVFCIKLDRKRGPFLLGNDKIARLIIDTVNLDKRSQAARSLLNFKQSDVDFASLCKSVIQDRLNNKSSNISFNELHKYLDQIANAESSVKARIFLELLLRLSPNEMFWFIRILLKDLKIKLTGEAILLLFAPEAEELWATHTDLEYVVSASLSGVKKQSLSIGHSFKPMLTKRANKIQDPFTTSSNKTLYIEEKIDGERVILHKLKDNYKFYTKNYQDDTTKYGTIHEGLLTPFIHSSINALDVILDGEMIAIKNGRVLRYGSLRKFFGHKNDYIDAIEEDVSGAQIKFIVFDILKLGPEDLTGLPLEQRKQLLRKVVTDNEYIQVISFKICSMPDILEQMLKTEVLNKKEGIVAKNPLSKYICGGRGPEWYKLKAATLNNMNHDFDMVIVGSYYGRGSNSGKLVSFLCAIIEDKHSMSMRFASICKATSIRKEQLEYIQDKFRDYGIAYLSNNWLIHPNRNKPDFLIDPVECCIIVELSGHEFIPVDENDGLYGFKYTIRFPTTGQIRTDKSLEDCECVKDITAFISNSYMISAFKTQGSSDNSKKEMKPSRKRKQLSIIHLKKSKPANTILNVLNGFSFICDIQHQAMVSELGGIIGPIGNDIVVTNDFDNHDCCVTPAFINHIYVNKSLNVSIKLLQTHTKFKSNLYDLFQLQAGVNLLDVVSPSWFNAIAVNDEFDTDLIMDLNTLLLTLPISLSK